MIGDARLLRDALVAKGWALGEDLAYLEAEDGEHNERSWGARVGPMLEFLFPTIMNREFHRWYSPSLGRDMDLLVFGHAGARVIVFPTSMGKFFEWEDQRHDRRARRAARARMAAAVLRRQRRRRQLVRQVEASGRSRVPSRAVRRLRPRRGRCRFACRGNQNPFLMTTGASFGAYHAVTFALRYPHLVEPGDRDERDVRHSATDGWLLRRDDLPLQSGRLHPGRARSGAPGALKRLDLILAIGRDDSMRGENEEFSGRLWSKGIWHALRIWDGWSHDWPYWREMIRVYGSGRIDRRS